MSEAERASRRLAALLFAELDIDIAPYKLRALIRDRWRTIAPLAHIVHTDPDDTKEPATSAPIKSQL